LAAVTTTRVARGALVVLTFGVLLGACGEESFKNEPRPPVGVVLSGVIHDDGVTVSPAKVGAGPISITIANQTDARHTITLEGDSVQERVGPIGPSDTATIKRDLAPGDYEVRAGSEQAVSQEIPPATLTIGAERPNSNDELLMP
jgi:hypothetical protein